jgi:hypothetical protein
MYSGSGVVGRELAFVNLGAIDAFAADRTNLRAAFIES